MLLGHVATLISHIRTLLQGMDAVFRLTPLSICR
jgi:hypothetical protein